MSQQDVADGPSDVGRDVPAASERPRSAAGARKAAVGHEAWFSGAGLRRRFSKPSEQAPKPRDQGFPGAGSVAGRQQQAGRLSAWMVATFAFAALAVAALAIAALSLAGVITAPGRAPGAAPVDVGAYLRGMASWHEEAAPVDLDPYHTAQPTPEECAAPDALPAVKVLCAAAADKLAEAAAQRAEQRAAPVSELDALALDCLQAANAEACAAAAAANAYEGSQDVATETLDAHWTLDSALDAAGEGTGSVMDALALDCEADPAACAAAAGMNTYEGLSAGTADPESAQAWQAQQAAEAEAKRAAWGARDVGDLDLDCSAAATRDDPARLAACATSATANRYEGGERWAATRRIAMEAAPEYLGLYYLNLDCSDADPEMQAECQRSKAANRYESKPRRRDAAAAAAAQAGRAQAAAEAYRQRYKTEIDVAAEYAAANGGARTPGYDVVADAAPSEALPAAEYGAAAAGARTPGYDAAAVEPAADPDDLHAASLHSELAAYRAAQRTVGYDVPAVEWDPIASQLQHGGGGGDAPRAADGHFANRKGGSCACGEKHEDPYHAEDARIEAARQHEAAQHAQLAHDGPHADALHQHQERAAYLTARTVGYDVPSVDAGAQAAAAYAAESARSRTPGYDARAADAAFEASERHARAAHPHYRRARRTLGYDMPAVGAGGEWDAVAAHGEEVAAAAGAPSGGAGKRLYYKQPLNSPSGRKHYKDGRSAAQHRVYYKSPANAPTEPAEPAQAPQAEAAAGSSWRPGLATQVLAYAALGIASAAYLLTRLRRRVNQAPADGVAGRVPSILAGGADQLLTEAAAGGGVLAEPIPDHIDSPRASNFDSPRLARKAELAGRADVLEGELAAADDEALLMGSLPRSPRIARPASPGARARTAASPLGLFARDGGGKGGDAAGL